MGQYHFVVNLDKREFLHPHKLGDGLKLWEQGAGGPGTLAALHMLLAVSNGRGGGDYHELEDTDLAGRWGGDRIAVVGDYGEPGDLPADVEAKLGDAGTIYGRCSAASYPDEADGEDTDGWTDLSEVIAPFIEREFQFRYVGDGWRHRVNNTPGDGGFGFDPANLPDYVQREVDAER